MPHSPILGGFSTARSPSLASNDSYNLFAEIVETKDGKAPGALYNAPGLDLIASLGTGPIRGVRDLQDILYVVSGGDVYSLTPNGIATHLGTIGLRPGPVSMFDNGTQLMIVDGVGGWLVPGGYPLTGGTINGPGGLYAVGDTITLQPVTVTANSYPILTVTAVANAPVTAFILPNTGTAYSTASAVATSVINGNLGGGSGLTVDIVASGGLVVSWAVSNGGSGYAVGDTGVINAFSEDAPYLITAVSGGAVTAFILLTRGSNYSSASGVATARTMAVPTNAGLGLTLNITAAGGGITASSVANGGRGYVLGNVGFISGGTGDATYQVTEANSNGSVTGFIVSQAGATVEPAIQYTQKSTSGSGANLILTAPIYGAFVGIVPVTLPFPKPIMGDTSDGFGLLVFDGSQKIAQSDNLDLSTWQPLNYGVASQSPDNCMALKVAHNEAFVLKQRNTEVWADAGQPGFSFSPLGGVHMEWGIWARFSLAKAGDILFWLSRNDQGQSIVVRAPAYQATPISTQALIAEFETYPNVGDAIGYCFQQGGHTFYVLTFPEADKTWAYDLTSSDLGGVPLWHRLASWDAEGWHRHWGNCFWPWKRSVTLDPETTTYQAQSVKILPPVLGTTNPVNGLPPSFFAAVFSVWLDIPDGGGNGPIFFTLNSGGTHSLSIVIQNDSTGSPQITIKAWDVSGAMIVSATYNFAVWSAWVNILISINAATHQLQVYANTIVSNKLAEKLLIPVSVAWTSSNPIAGRTTASGSIWNDGGVLVLPFNSAGFSITSNGEYVSTVSGYPSAPTGLAAGAVWNDGQAVGIIPGITPNPSAPAVYFGSITPAVLLALGGGNLPLTNPGVGTKQLWNDGGLVAIA
jgi:hypothetical protein